MKHMTQKEIDLNNLRHGLSHCKGELLSINNIIKQLKVKKESLETEIKTIQQHLEEL